MGQKDVEQVFTSGPRRSFNLRVGASDSFRQSNVQRKHNLVTRVESTGEEPKMSSVKSDNVGAVKQEVNARSPFQAAFETQAGGSDEDSVIIIEDEEEEEDGEYRDADAGGSDEDSVIIIEDEEEEEEDGEYRDADADAEIYDDMDSDSESIFNRGSCENWSSSSCDVEDENEDDDELQFLGSRINPPFRKQPLFQRVQVAAEADTSDWGSSCDSDKESSDCEVLDSSHPWEEAALKKQATKKDAFKGRQEEKRMNGMNIFDQLKRNGHVEQKQEDERPAKRLKTTGVKLSAAVDIPLETKGTASQMEAVKAEICTKTTNGDMDGRTAPVVDRERLMQTAEFRNADEQEWASRQLELQRQALEAQKLKKRKKAEADRKLEMEIRQKERLEEMRESQKKEERTMCLKEQIRGQVQADLERIASVCLDMASLLRKLGIGLGEERVPSIEQVNAAYKKALLKFHPDRASASGDIRCQVEAEEKFKLISRMKNVLRPVSEQPFVW